MQPIQKRMKYDDCQKKHMNGDQKSAKSGIGRGTTGCLVSAGVRDRDVAGGLFRGCRPEDGGGKEAQYAALIKKRSKRIPLQHLTGVQEFMDWNFSVNEHVPIPRQDTEVLVETALDF